MVVVCGKPGAIASKFPGKRGVVSSEPFGDLSQGHSLEF